MNKMLEIREINHNDSKLWNDFVISNIHSNYSHLYEWKVIFEHSYSLKTIYISIFDDNVLIAALPLCLMDYPTKKTFAISLPYLNFTGLIKSDSYEESTLLELIEVYLKNKGLSYIELRSISHKPGEFVSGICTLQRKLPQDHMQLWDELNAKVKNQVRKAEKIGLSPKWGKNQLDVFYSIYARNMRDLGTPVHGKNFFENIIKILNDYVQILTIYKGDIAIAGMFLVKFKNSLSDPWASSLKEYLDDCPNMLMYWEALKYGCALNLDEFDFGRSEYNSGTFKFKKQWGAYPIALDYRLINYSEREIKTTISTYNQNKAAHVKNMWKLMPYKISLWLGPKIRKYIP
ncbi:MAG: GNAT family N-acetyltransferase [Ignavibacteriales bacterium]|nr:GNAT family N-acetyltransferase [Ignavibacteriales bacterium]